MDREDTVSTRLAVLQSSSQSSQNQNPFGQWAGLPASKYTQKSSPGRPEKPEKPELWGLCGPGLSSSAHLGALRAGSQLPLPMALIAFAELGFCFKFSPVRWRLVSPVPFIGIEGHLLARIEAGE